MADATRPDSRPQAFTDFGALLKYLRRRAGLTQSELALAVGYSREQITKLENNQRLPEPTTLTAVFIPALSLERQPALAEQLLHLAAAARRARDAQQRDEPPPGTAPPPAATNLPTPLTRFIGREREIVEIKRLLGAARLLTLTGAGGVGKTRLALQLGSEVLESFADGVWLVELAALTDPKLIANAIALSLGLSGGAQRPLETSLAEYLRDKHLLLILDNCEHLLVATARLAEALLRESAGLHILATSRESLGILSATTWHVPSLTVPDPDLNDPSEAGLEQLTRSEAVQLFLDRAASHNPTFILTPANAPYIAQICRRLDGIPLAIELTTDLVYALSVEQIAARLNNRFQLLSGGNNTALPRHQTLRAAIDWSYELLTEPERRLLRQLAVFNSGWTLEAAEGLSRAPATPAVLARLVDKSLVVMARLSGQPRYYLLETIRAYAREQLQNAGELDETLDRHLDYFVEQVEQVEPRQRGPQQQPAYQFFEIEMDNLRAALDWAIRHGCGPAAVRLLASLWFFWFWRGYWHEGATWARTVFESTELLLPANQAKARALIGAANLAGRSGDYAHFNAWLQAGRALAEELGDEEYMAWARIAMSLQTADYAQVAALLEEALGLARAAGNTWLVADILFMYGDRARASGQSQRAEALYTESVALFQAAGNRDVIANPIGNLGRLAFERGDYAAARAAFEHSLALLRAMGNKPGVADWLMPLGRVALQQGDYALVRVVLNECLPLCREIGNQEAIADCLVIAAGLAQALGQLEQAAQLLGAAGAILEQFNLLHQIVDPANYAEFTQTVSQARQHLPEPAFETAWLHGQSLSTPAAVELALAIARD